MDEPCSRDQLRGCLRDIARINRWITRLSARARLAQCASGLGPALRRAAPHPRRGLAAMETDCAASSNGRRRAASPSTLPASTSIRMPRRLPPRPVRPRAESIGSMQTSFNTRRSRRFISSSVRSSRITLPKTRLSDFCCGWSGTPSSDGSSTISPALQFRTTPFACSRSSHGFIHSCSTTLPFPSRVPSYRMNGERCAPPPASMIVKYSSRASSPRDSASPGESRSHRGRPDDRIRRHHRQPCDRGRSCRLNDRDASGRGRPPRNPP